MSQATVALINDQGDLLAWIDSRAPECFGATYSPEEDGLRMNTQLWAVWHAMRRGDWVTLPALRACCPGLETSISARIRQIRSWLQDTGRGTVEGERLTGGLWRYRIVRTWPVAGTHYR